MANGTHSSRPRFLNLIQIRMPVMAWTSIGHRVSGILLFLSIPILTYLLQLSLYEEQGFAAIHTLFNQTPMKWGLGLILWAVFHHLLAGIRVLLIDLELGLDKSSARLTAWSVNTLAILLALLGLWRLW